jgi:hypothetical protein
VVGGNAKNDEREIRHHPKLYLIDNAGYPAVNKTIKVVHLQPAIKEHLLLFQKITKIQKRY